MYLRDFRVSGEMSYICSVYCFDTSNKTSHICLFKMYDETAENRCDPCAIKPYSNEQGKIPT